MALEIELKKIGFSDKEAKVYLALLELGEDSVQNIGKKAKVNRATTYVILESLKKQGAVSTIEKGKKTLFVAENPSILLRYFTQKTDELESSEREFRQALPELQALSNILGEKPRVRFFEGKEGIHAVREDMLTHAKGEILDIYSRDEIQGFFTKKESREFSEKRKAKKIGFRGIYTSSEGPGTFTTPGERKFLPKHLFPFSADISIYGTHIAFTALKGTHVVVIIESKEIADTMRLTFELAWKGADLVKKK